MSRSSREVTNLLTQKALFGLLGLVSLITLSGCSIFSQDAEDTRPPAVLKQITPQLTVSTLWKTSVGDHGENLGLGLAPVVKDAVVYVAGHNGIVMAVNAETGKRKWSSSTGVNLSAGPGVGAGRVVVGSNNGDVIGLDTETGNEIWRSKISGEILSSPAVSAEQVAVHSANGTLNVLSASTGAALWQDEQEVPRLSLRGSSSPRITSGVVLSASDAGKITSYNGIDGAVLWERLLGLPRGTTELERLIDIDGKIELNGTDLFAVGYNSRLAKIDARSGNMLWANENSSSTGVGLGWKNVYISDSDGHVIAVDQESGSQVWKNEDYKFRELSAPVSTGRAIVVGDLEGYVHFLSPENGSTIARQKISKSAIRMPAVSANNTLYIQSDDGNVVAFKILGE